MSIKMNSFGKGGVVGWGKEGGGQRAKKNTTKTIHNQKDNV